MKKLLSVFGMIVLSGCAAFMVNVPGQTSASPRLKSDIANTINMIERAQAPGCSSKIVDTKVTGTTGDTVHEDWIVESCGKQIIYPVELTPDPKGGSYFGVTTPKRTK